MVMSLIRVAVLTSLWVSAALPAYAAETVPTDIQMPGTQPGEIGNLEAPTKCDNCHGGYDAAVEPAHNWRGSMMAHAGRDPIFWATVAVAEQDFDGVGDLCIRCHSTEGWIEGRSTPTDGSALTRRDASGVACDFCHKATNPNDSEWLGVQNPPFVANDGGTPATGYYGSGMASLWAGNQKLGPYNDAEARHQFQQSQFHRSPDFCGMCHDVSNPAVGDLAHNNGAQVPLPPGSYSGVPGAPVDQKAAFNNVPYQYGIVERTFSEYKAGLLSTTLVSAYSTLPADLQAGAIQFAYERALIAGTNGNYADNSPRYFTCQTCHLPATEGKGCSKGGAPTRRDLPQHDMTGGNYWMPDAILYLDGQDKLRLGGGMTTDEISGLMDGKLRAMANLSRAATLSASGNTLRVVNLTGHKLITGYPEGRRMWLNIKWYDGGGALLREDGAYDWLTVSLDGDPISVRTIVDLHDPYLRIYEAHYGMTQEWANQLLALGYPSSLVLSYDRITGQQDYTLGDLAAQALGTCHETFHFVLNNYVTKDTRIPPYGMRYDEAMIRNALPVPANQYGDPGAGGTYDYWDEANLDPPAGAASATIDLLYQPTSWEYIQFLYLANNEQNVFLADEGEYLLEAWLNTGMAEPYVMTSATWGETGCVPSEPAEVTCSDGVDNDCDGATDCDDTDCSAEPNCQPGVCDNDGICEAGEDCNSCAGDCISGGAGGCGNGVCEPGLGEDCVSCSADCAGKQSGNPSRQYCCGDGDGSNPVGCEDPRCNSEEYSCSNAPAEAYCCGDGSCEGAEDSCNCAVDCGPPSATEADCTDGFDNDCDGAVDCDDTDCGAEPNCQPAACDNDGICDPGEDCLNCETDCEGKQSGNPANRYCCGNGIPEGPEGDGTLCDGNY
jgi:hypothetical protein